MTDHQLEEAAIIFAFFNIHPHLPDNLTPRGYWKTWSPAAKEHYRNKVRAVNAALETDNADAGLVWVKRNDS